MYKQIMTAIICALILGACSNAKQAQAEAPATAGAKPSASFNADSAYAYIAQQTSYGPRVPGSQASRLCAAWMAEKLRSVGACDIEQQRAQITAYNGDKLDICNISARLNPDIKRRMLLVAHWDSRPWADQEKDPSLRRQPIDGANDGASGVGVILELARCLQGTAPKYGVDILLVDAEDYGRHADEKEGVSDEDTWCLGTQYWIDNPTLDLKSIRFAVLLDMVGGKDAVFPREYISDYGAGNIVDMVWKAAEAAGCSDRFPNIEGGAVIDDHVYLLRAGLPAIDIIENDNPSTGSFNPTWHTHADNIDNIDKSSLQAVGNTLLQLILQ